MTTGKQPARHRRPERRPKAKAAEVLARSTAAKGIPSQWRWHCHTLEDLQRHFRGQERRLKRDAEQAYTGMRHEPADVATNTYDRDWALAMLSSDTEALFEIDAALERIRDGTYGVCELTGQPIPPERLQAIPWTRFTAEAERQLEAEGRMPRPKSKLGPRERIPRETPPESYEKE